MKRRRETAQFFQYQQRLLNIGAPKMDSRRWGNIINIYIYYVNIIPFCFFKLNAHADTRTYNIYIYV